MVDLAVFMARGLGGGGRRVLGAVLLGVTLTGSGLAAYAAEPSAPEQLPAEVVGVVGSGDQMALRLVRDKQERTIKPGEEYRDGWKLDAVTPTSATLVKDGERRQVGLNPTGQLASATPAAPSQVRVLMSDEDLLAEIIRQGGWDGKTPRTGLTLEQTARYQILSRKGGQLASQQRPRPADGQVRLINGNMIAEALGADGAEYKALQEMFSQATTQLAVEAFDRYGPIEIPRTNSDTRADSAKMAAYPGARWTVRGGDSPAYVMMRPDTAIQTVGAGPIGLDGRPMVAP